MSAESGSKTDRLLYQGFDTIKTKFVPSNAASRTLAKKRFGCIIGNFTIAAAAKKQ